MNNATVGAGDGRRSSLGEEVVPLQGGRSEDERKALAAAEVLAADDPEPATAVPDVDLSSLGMDAVPLRDDSERREAEERDARLRLMLPRRRFRRS